jgi:hypothetical protein
MMAGIILVLLVLAGCTMTPRLANVSGAEGNKPEHYEQTIREHLRPSTGFTASASR